jgi:hypothetical protein
VAPILRTSTAAAHFAMTAPPSPSPLVLSQEQRVACMIKGNISFRGERIYRDSATTTRPKSKRAKGNAGSAPSKKPSVLVGEK